MKIQYQPKGDILRKEGEHVIVNPVNCAGVMGAGLALLFKKQYPHYFADYKQKCVAGTMRVGRVDAYQNEPWQPTIISFPTKNNDWRDLSLMYNIERGMVSLRDWLIDNNDVQSCGIPMLGCGLGGLRWSNVEREIYDTLCIDELSEISFVIYGQRTYNPPTNER